MNKVEDSIIKILRQFNLRDALIVISQLSQFIFHNGDNGFAIRNDATKEFYDQEVLAHMTQLLIKSGANDFPIVYLSQENKLFQKIYDQIRRNYRNELDQKIIDTESVNPHHSLIRIFSGFYDKQFKFQTIDIHPLMAKSKLIFIDGLKEIKPPNDMLKNIFEDFAQSHMGISIEKFVKIAFLITRLQDIDARNNFYHGYITDVNIEDKLKKQNPDLFQEEKFYKVLQSLSLPYQEFREKDGELNPLIKYPLIKPDMSKIKLVNQKREIFLLPCYPLFFLRAFDQGLFDFFDDFYAIKLKDPQRRAFRAYYGLLYENYVKKVLIQIFGEEKVKSINDSDKHADFLIEIDNLIYVIEVKSFVINSYQTLQYQNQIKIIDNDIKKIEVGISQLKENTDRVKKTNPKKKIIPLMILNEGSSFLLLSSSTNGTNLIRKDFKFKYLNFSNVEQYFDALKAQAITLESLAQDSHRASLTEAKVNRQFEMGNKFFDGIVHDFYQKEILSFKSA
ncbi:MAG: hypothetical protein LW817_03875 [Candidatus Caenarcaniphilales bacterium]|jgi:hypothetical protein|nr:hypothetical protein [Candidatus Caenarcaniphilales bacterium]